MATAIAVGCENARGSSGIKAKTNITILDKGHI